MKESTPKEQILSKVRNALIEKNDNPYQDMEISSDVLKVIDPDEEMIVAFARELIQSGGNFIYCENEQAFIENLADLMQNREWNQLWCQNPKILSLLAAAEIPFFELHQHEPASLISITSCEKLIASTGSILVSDMDAGSREIFSLADIHLVMAYSTQVVGGLKAALQAINAKYPAALPGQLTFITGPSRTADIEKTLVRGAHGPKELIVFLIDDL